MVFLTRTSRTASTRRAAPVELLPQQSPATRLSAGEGNRPTACSYWVRRRRAQGKSSGS